MKFKINNNEWTIREVDEVEMGYEEKNDYTLGVTEYKKQEIRLLKNYKNKKRTLIHELTHVWLFEYGHNQHDKEFSFEDICEIVASSNNFINEVVEKYFLENCKDEKQETIEVKTILDK